ncbi:pca operon transcription factor PcaQ [Foliimonas ilicis]
MSSSLLDGRIKLRQIICFLEVARQKSVVKAAAALNISQPAASKTIAELESILGVSLFDRSRRNLHLTPFGEAFERYASNAVSALRQGVAAANQQQSDPVIKIGALPTVSATVLPHAVKTFTENGASASVRIVTGPNAYLLSLLRQGDVDLVLGRMAEPDAISGLSFEHLYSERIAAVVRPMHPLLVNGSLDLAEVEQFPILMPPPGSVIRPTVERLLATHGGSSPRSEVETVSNAFGRSFTRITDAVWFISEGVVADDVAEGILEILPLDTSETLGPVGLTMRTDTPLSFSAGLLVQAIRDVSKLQFSAGLS